MSYNPYLFKKIYNSCSNIINQTNDKNLKKKKKNLEFAYKRVQETDNCEIQEFFSVAHELRTYELLKKLNKQVLANNDDKAGVDFVCNLGNIECVTFNMPKDDNSKKILNGNMNRYKAYEPRVSQAINEKLNKYRTYILKNQIDKNLPNIICLNSGICGYDIHSSTFLNACERIIYGLGDDTLFINRETKEEFWGRSFQDKIIKPNGKEIETNLFSNKAYNIISGVLLIDNLVDENYSRPILYINPNAKIKIDKRRVRKMLCLIKDDELKYHYSCNGKLTSVNQYKGVK